MNTVLEQLLSEILFFLLELISLLHVVHEFLHVHLKGKSTISVKSSEEILAEVPSIPSNHGAAFFSLLRAEVQLIASLTFQEEDTRDFSRAVW